MKLSIEHLNYKVSEKKILDDISFTIDDGDILALLGHNGAGKTSLFEVITNIIKPDSGSILFSNKQIFTECKTRAGVLWDNITLFPWLKVKEVIRYVLSMHRIKTYSIESYNHLGINTIENSFMHKLSKGEKRKVELFLAIVHEPDFLILDEPTSSLDPIIRDYVWDNIILKKHRTILFSTHQWNEAEKYANKILFIHNGKLLNSPESSSSLIENSKLKNKVSVHKNIKINNIEAFSYQSESNVNFLIAENDDASLNKIKSQTMNYSILPIDLTDVYQHLITTAQ
jgi:ABC-2 type transport system ATP-binding protein